MIWEISKLILIPILLGLVYNKLVGNRWAWFQDQLPNISMFSIGAIIVIITANGRDALLAVEALTRSSLFFT